MDVLRNLLDQEFRGKPDHFESEANLEEEGLCGLWGPCLFMPLFFFKKQRRGPNPSFGSKFVWLQITRSVKCQGLPTTFP